MEPVSSAFSAQLGKDQFLQLLVAQLRQQDPLDPVKDREFVSQLAELSVLEGVENLNASFSDMLSLQQLTEGTQLIGKTITFTLPSATTPEQGVVQGFESKEGRVHLVTTEGVSVRVDRVDGVAETVA